jgi:hypothetical protein
MRWSSTSTARRIATARGTARVGAIGELSERDFRVLFSESSGTTGVAHETGSRKLPESICTSFPARTISALERRERDARRGDSDIDFPYLSLYDSYHAVNADKEGWVKRPIGVKPYS